MPPEIITTKRDTEIGRLLERVIRDHRKDISAFSKGSWLRVACCKTIVSGKYQCQIYFHWRVFALSCFHVVHKFIDFLISCISKFTQSFLYAGKSNILRASEWKQFVQTTGGRSEILGNCKTSRYQIEEGSLGKLSNTFSSFEKRRSNGVPSNKYQFIIVISTYCNWELVQKT